MDRHLGYEVGADGSEIESAARRGSLRAPVDQCLAEVATKAADRDAGGATGDQLRAASHATLDCACHRHAGHALHGFAEAGVRESANVLRGDGVDDTDRLFF